MPRPAPQDSAEFYHNYIGYVKGDHITEALANHSEEIINFYLSLPAAKADYAYSEGKWTVKEIVQHVMDAERVFTYRALRFSRKDATPLSSFDENRYAANAQTASRSLQSLKEEFMSLRNATDIMLSTFTEDQLNTKGTASNHSITVNALAFIILGHLLHHKKILQERYL